MALGISDICDASGASMSAAQLPLNLSEGQIRALDVISAGRLAANEQQLTPMDSGLMFREVVLSLATLSTNGAYEFSEAGVEVIFSQVGSSPGALLKIKAGGVLSAFAPGSRMKQPFTGFTIEAAVGCATLGNARLIIVKKPGYDYQEPVTISQGNQLATLLGSVDSAGALAFVSVATDTAPAGESPAGSFDVSGWKALDVYCDLGAGDRLATIEVWFKPRGSTQWFLNQGAEVTTMASLSGMTSTPALRQFTMGLYGEPGKLYFTPVNASGAVGFHVKGIY